MGELYEALGSVKVSYMNVLRERENGADQEKDGPVMSANGPG